MKHSSIFLYTLATLISLTPQIVFSHDHDSGIADAPCEVPLFAGLEARDSLNFAVTIASQEAKAYFDQGVLLAYGFNHDEARRSFAKAAQLDPGCAMCFWGQALVLGPNINKPMTEAEEQLAIDMVRAAQAALDSESQRERDFIAALAVRYRRAGQADRSTLDKSYADAMSALHEKYPDDLNAAILLAEALMDLTPWNYWTPAGTPGPSTEKIIGLLNAVLEKDSLHPGANHLLIHVVEAVRPHLAEAAADRLNGLVPGSGHLQHMPSHIYIRIGRYHDAVQANIAGIASDKSYLAGCHVRGFYPMMYIPHNYDFLAATAYLSGQSALTLETGAALRAYAEPWLMSNPDAMPDMQQFWSSEILALVRFGRWNEILQERRPHGMGLLALANWHYARALAFAHRSDFAASKVEISELDRLRLVPQLRNAILMGINRAEVVFAIASLEARGILAAAEGDLNSSATILQQAVAQQDALAYMEPPAWHRSVRIELGRVLLNAQKWAEAEATYLRDLQTFPENGYALHGLMKALEGQQRIQEVGEVRERYRAAFRFADIDL